MAITGSKIKLNNFAYALENELNGYVLLNVNNGEIITAQYVTDDNIDDIKSFAGTEIESTYYYFTNTLTDGKTVNENSVKIETGINLKDVLQPKDFTVHKEILNTISDGTNPSKLIDAVDIDWRPYTYELNGEHFNLKDTSDLLEMIESLGKSLYAVTYDTLCDYVDNKVLTVGAKYIITDYVTTTTITDTQSANKSFKIIVTADSTSTFNCKATAIGFSGANASKWELWYDINNDTSKYSWADPINGKGVIYRMIDEYGNDCPYDFKNIQFKHGDKYYFTFGGENDDTLTGASYNNIIKPCINPNQILNNILLGTNSFNNYFGFNTHDIIIGSADNDVKNACNNITFENGTNYIDLIIDITTSTIIEENITVKSGIHGTNTTHKIITVNNEIFTNTKNIEFKPANSMVYEIN